MNTKTDDARIMFHADDKIMEVDFSEILFDSAQQVNNFYDLVDKKMAETGQDKWYFLVNYKNCRVALAAWIPFANRGKRINIASSLGSVRYAVSEETGKNILKQSEKEDFDPNLFTSRQAAVDHIAGMKAEAAEAEANKANETAAAAQAATQTAAQAPQPTESSVDNRIAFIDDLEIMDVDFSNYVFSDIAKVNEFYDALASRIANSGREKWYFLVNYDGTKIFPDAWYQWAIRSRRLNSAHSLGTVRFNPDEAAKKDIVKRAGTDESDPNLFSTRDDALARIAQMRADA